MKSHFPFRPFFHIVLFMTAYTGGGMAQATDTLKIVLLAGTVQEVDRPGHHVYLGGSRLMQDFLKQTPGVEAVLVTEGWPEDEPVSEGTAAIVFYTDGAGKEHLGSPEGGPADVVAWTFDCPDGGRSFNFRGPGAHSAWERVGMRTLVINDILWSAGIEISEGGAKCEADQAWIASFLTPWIAPASKVQTPTAPVSDSALKQ